MANDELSPEELDALENLLKSDRCGIAYREGYAKKEPFLATIAQARLVAPLQEKVAALEAETAHLRGVAVNMLELDHVKTKLTRAEERLAKLKESLEWLFWQTEMRISEQARHPQGAITYSSFTQDWALFCRKANLEVGSNGAGLALANSQTDKE